MKRLLITIVLAAAVSVISFIAFRDTPATAEKQVDTTINMQVYAAANYTSDAYKGSNASLHVTVNKVKDNNREIVWEMDYPALELKAFPENMNAFKQQINIPAILGQANLEIDYTLTYNSNGNILQMQNTEMIDAAKENTQLFIEI